MSLYPSNLLPPDKLARTASHVPYLYIFCLRSSPSNMSCRAPYKSQAFDEKHNDLHELQEVSLSHLAGVVSLDYFAKGTDLR